MDEEEDISISVSLASSGRLVEVQVVEGGEVRTAHLQPNEARDLAEALTEFADEADDHLAEAGEDEMMEEGGD